MHLDTLTPLQASVGYGLLGTGGALGYEGKEVTVAGVRHTHALSTHPPARVLFDLGGRASRFRCRVALNDDVPPGASHADFAVVADGRTVATANEVAAGQPPRELAASLDGVHLLELVVATSRWDYSHAVWLEPEVDGAPSERGAQTIEDCLRRATITLPPPLPRVERCVATVASPGFDDWLDDLLGSLSALGGCSAARVVVLLLGTSPACERIVAKYRALPVHCRPRAPINVGSKALLYSIARVVDAERYVCLDADMLVLDDLTPLFGAIDACPVGSVLASREGNDGGYDDVGQALEHTYGGSAADVARILGEDRGERDYRLVTNDGLFAASRGSLLALDAAIRAMPAAVEWVDERPDVAWRNQLVFNLALARLGCGVELDPTWNLQLHTADAELEETAAGPRAHWQGRRVRVLHANGWGREKVARLRGSFAADAPLAGAGDGDLYAEFLRALRLWTGRRGSDLLKWSFYGTRDATAARVRDPSMLPVAALLHYLLRAQGCVRVLETGTGLGVSAACIASAVAHREGGRVVTLDPWEPDERAALWAALPEPMARAIEARAVDALEGMRRLLDAGEQFDAALLDSLHTEEHLRAELELAHRLVCPGGLILVHDTRWIDELERVVADAQRDGYGVARLLSSECGVLEDDGLGLTVIENRRLA